jgi:hypothetical protein
MKEIRLKKYCAAIVRNVHAKCEINENQAYAGNQSTTEVGGMQVYHVLELGLISSLVFSSLVVVVAP